MTFYLHTYGCQMNVRDSDAVASELVSAGYEMAKSEDEADIVIVNSCSVREKAEDKAVGKLRMLCVMRDGRKARIVGLMGCMGERYGAGIFKKVDMLSFAVGSRAAKFIPEAIARVVAGEKHVYIHGDITSGDVPCGHYDVGMSTFVTILLGCNRRCSYCIVPDVRGPEYSRKAEDVISEVTCLAKRGLREVTLLGQSVMNYGRGREKVWDEEPSGAFTEHFPRLLEAVSKVEGIARIRFTSGHPSGCTEELARAMRDLPNVCHHLHLPVQSGSNRILREMRRGYTREQYLAAIERLRWYVPDVAITTDIIVGYPGESEEDFEETRLLMREAKFDNSFVFKYSPRPGTPSALLEDDVTDEEKDRRNKVLLQDQDEISISQNEFWVGKEVEVLVEGPSLRNQNRFSGRSSQNKIVVFEPSAETKRGDIVRVKIDIAHPQTLFGTLI